MSFRDKVVVVTGGSAGLGLAIAKAFQKAGARIALLGRDEQRLAAAKDELGEASLTLPTDMTAREQVDQATSAIVDRWGQIDVWVNNVGVSSRGNALETSVEQFQHSLEVNFFTAVNGAQAAAPHLRQTQGSLVFIGSLASKTASRYLAAYPPAKYALAGYAHQLRLELGEEDVHVLLVCPGPIERSDAGDRYNEQAAELPDSANRPGGGARVKLLAPDRVAERIVTACERRQSELVLPGKAKWLFAISQLSPSLGDWILKRSTDS